MGYANILTHTDGVDVVTYYTVKEYVFATRSVTYCCVVLDINTGIYHITLRNKICISETFTGFT